LSIRNAKCSKSLGNSKSLSISNSNSKSLGPHKFSETLHLIVNNPILSVAEKSRFKEIFLNVVYSNFGEYLWGESIDDQEDSHSKDSHSKDSHSTTIQDCGTGTHSTATRQLTLHILNQITKTTINVLNIVIKRKRDMARASVFGKDFNSSRLVLMFEGLLVKRLDGDRIREEAYRNYTERLFGNTGNSLAVAMSHYDHNSKRLLDALNADLERFTVDPILTNCNIVNTNGNTKPIVNTNDNTTFKPKSVETGLIYKMRKQSILTKPFQKFQSLIKLENLNITGTSLGTSLDDQEARQVLGLSEIDKFDFQQQKEPILTAHSEYIHNQWAELELNKVIGKSTYLYVKSDVKSEFEDGKYCIQSDTTDKSRYLYKSVPTDTSKLDKYRISIQTSIPNKYMIALDNVAATRKLQKIQFERVFDEIIKTKVEKSGISEIQDMEFQELNAAKICNEESNEGSNEESNEAMDLNNYNQVTTDLKNRKTKSKHVSLKRGVNQNQRLNSKQPQTAIKTPTAKLPSKNKDKLNKQKSKLKNSRKDQTIKDQFLVENNSKLPFTFPKDLQLDFEEIWSKLKFKSSQKVEMAVKYVSHVNMDDVVKSILMWKVVAELVLERVYKVEGIRQFEMVASDPK
jgi:hypothetical protein